MAAKKRVKKPTKVPDYTANYLYSYWNFMAASDISALRRVARVLTLSPQYVGMFGGEDDAALRAIADRVEQALGLAAVADKARQLGRR